MPSVSLDSNISSGSIVNNLQYVIIGAPNVGPHLTKSNSSTQPNDNIANAFALTLDVPQDGSLINSTLETNEFDPLDATFGTGFGATLRSGGNGSVWYSFTATIGGTHVIKMTYVTEDTLGVHVVYDGASGTTVDTINPVVDAITGAVFFQSGPLFTGGIPSLSFTINLTIGQSLYIQAWQEIPGAVAPGMLPTNDMEFTILVTKPNPVLTANIQGKTIFIPSDYQQITSSIVSGNSLVAANLELYQLFGSTIHGRAKLNSILTTENNSNITTYFADPTVGPGGSITSATGPYPNNILNETGITIFEAVGSTGTDLVIIDNEVALLSQDIHSNNTPLNYTVAPIDGVTNASGTFYTYERWLQFRFQGPFNTIDHIRLWCRNLSDKFPGWTFKWGTTTTYSAPVNSASTIATNSLLTSDPGFSSNNLMITPGVVVGTGDYFTKWIVLQASVDVSTANRGPWAGVTSEGGTPIPIELQISWIET